MWRSVLEPLGLFALPFVLYAVYLVLCQRYPFTLRAWSQLTVSVLTLVGLGVAVLGVFGFGLFAPRHLGPYVPAHMDNGRLVPGHFE
jgi:hypothetical protein